MTIRANNSARFSEFCKSLYIYQSGDTYGPGPIQGDTKEWAGTIYQGLADEKFYATYPYPGQEITSNPSIPAWSQGDIRAYYHTHGQCTSNNTEDDFSRPGINPKTGKFERQSDTNLSWASQFPMYVGTPGGAVLLFSPNPRSGPADQGTVTTVQPGNCCLGENYLK